ncbi:peptidoglycan/xylan/chitin deacetylase (PgdA/CDA1 family) [Kribbella aluminosa]|uniref:Peptidoglycan/xylan/chitin deacetylase (PgdA/CDA1 family) n=1 Tax=Kribbella aluminosa TaxID=416017 RepID=A0ABS4UFW0_9ACTN|nr:polysaccharide deacetylase family protein [Kribbella aluminosa]MBP2350532.1 peptidoglycan/xylan/chitin deacetylase (PgdA/CDA1 family) [Kribbella aluminosa]
MNSHIDRGALLLTFDDFFVPEWSAARDLLRLYDAHVTFFVSELDRLSDEDWPRLRELAADGHTVGAHGWRHLNAAVRVAEIGGDAFLREEIDPCVAGLRAEGLDPRCFAYPVSVRSDATDAVLTEVFGRLRGGCAVPEGMEPAQVDAIFTSVADLPGRRVLLGAGADNGRNFQPRGLTDVALAGALHRAAERNEALTLYAHAIADTHEANYITPARLTRLLDLAAELGLPCLAFDDLPLSKM